MNRYLDDFRDHPTEYLLERRALADGLVPEAHQAIEVVLAERGIAVPPIPKQAITMGAVSSALPRASIPLRVGLGIAAIVASAIATQLAGTWVGLGVTAAVLIYFARGRCPARS